MDLKIQEISKNSWQSLDMSLFGPAAKIATEGGISEKPNKKGKT